MEQWITTVDTKLAAAFGTLGMPIRVRNTFDELTGTEIVRFQVGVVNVEGNMETRRLRSCLKNGSLEAKEPAHPFLTILRAYRNRDMVLDCANKGTRIRLAPIPGTRLFQYLPGDSGLPGIAPGSAVIRTGDLKMVAALGIVGLGLLRIEGANGNRLYHVQAQAIVEGQPVDAAHLLRSWREDMESIPWSHPFAQAARGLYNRERLLDAVRRSSRTILIRKKKTIRSAVIAEEATEEAWDEVADFFGA
jgi:hypothetical protein